MDFTLLVLRQAGQKEEADGWSCFSLRTAGAICDAGVGDRLQQDPVVVWTGNKSIADV